MCHEIGHTLGLGHASANGTSQYMDYANHNEGRKSPSAHDFDDLEDKYAHDLGDRSTVGAVPASLLISTAAAPSSPTKSPSKSPTPAPITHHTFAHAWSSDACPHARPYHPTADRHQLRLKRLLQSSTSKPTTSPTTKYPSKP
jgi:hypothetical protein